MHFRYFIRAPENYSYLQWNDNAFKCRWIYPKMSTTIRNVSQDNMCERMLGVWLTFHVTMTEWLTDQLKGGLVLAPGLEVVFCGRKVRIVRPTWHLPTGVMDARTKLTFSLFPLHSGQYSSPCNGNPNPHSGLIFPLLLNISANITEGPRGVSPRGYQIKLTMKMNPHSWSKHVYLSEWKKTGGGDKFEKQHLIYGM